MHARLPQAWEPRRRHPAVQIDRRARLVQIRALALGWKMKSAGATPAYTLNHPRWYRKRVSTYWWLQRWEDLRFVLREVSSVFVAFFVVTTLLQLYAFSRGPEASAHFQTALNNPSVIAFNAFPFSFLF